MNPSPIAGRLTILLDEPLLGLDVFLKDLGWDTVRVKQGTSDDEVLRMAEVGGHVLVTPDGILAARCRLKGVRVAEVRLEEQAKLVDQMLRHFKTETEPSHR